MPTLTRFLIVLVLVAGAVGGGLYVLSERYAPEQVEMRHQLPSIKVKT